MLFSFLEIIFHIIYEDLTVGRIKTKDFPQEYAHVQYNIAVERFRKCLAVHPEFSRQLSDYDRSLLWRSNQPIAAALAACKVN